MFCSSVCLIVFLCQSPVSVYCVCYLAHRNKVCMSCMYCVMQRLIDQVKVPTQNRSFWRPFSHPMFWLNTDRNKTNTTKQACIHNKIYYNIKWTQKAKASFGCLLRPPAWKLRGPVVVSVLYKFVTYLDTHLQPRGPHGACHSKKTHTVSYTLCQ